MKFGAVIQVVFLSMEGKINPLKKYNYQQKLCRQKDSRLKIALDFYMSYL